MNIGIIGAGNIGGNLTRRFRELGHNVFVANSRGPESLADLASETGATPVSVTEAAQRGDVVIVTIPEKKIPRLPRDLFAEVPDSVVVVDTGNYYPQQRDGRIAGIFTEREMADRPRVERRIERVVKRFAREVFRAEKLLHHFRRRSRPRKGDGCLRSGPSGPSGWRGRSRSRWRRRGG